MANDLTGASLTQEDVAGMLQYEIDDKPLREWLDALGFRIPEQARVDEIVIRITPRLRATEVRDE